MKKLENEKCTVTDEEWAAVEKKPKVTAAPGSSKAVPEVKGKRKVPNREVSGKENKAPKVSKRVAAAGPSKRAIINDDIDSDDDFK